MLRRFLQSIHFEKESFIITIFLWAYVLCFVYHRFDFSLHDPSTIYFGQATLDGIDIGQRVLFFYKALFFGSLLFGLFYILVNAVSYYLLRFERVKQLMAILSGIGFFLIIADVYGFESKQSVNFVLCLSALYVLFCLVARKIKLCRHILQSTYFSAIIVLSFICAVMCRFLLNSSAYVNEHFNLFFFIIACLGCLKFVFWKTLLRIRSVNLFNLALPIVLVPVLIFTSTEAFFYFKQQHHISIHFVRWFCYILGGSYFLFFFYWLRSKHKISLHHLLSRWFVPAALLSFILLTFYSPLQTQPTDFFEMANPANAQMRMWRFHEWPCIDFMSSHMVSEQWFGVIYHFIFGYRGNLDFLVYAFFNSIIFYFLVYIFLVRVFKQSVLVFFFIICFPFLFTFFSETLIGTVFLFFAIQQILSDPKPAQYVLLFSTIFLLLCWRLDTGSAAITASIILIPLFHFSEKKRINLLNLTKGLGVFVAGIVLLFLLTIWLRSSKDIVSNFKNAFHYLSANQAHGYSQLSREMNQQFYFFYMMIPLITLFVIGYIVYLKRSKIERITVNEALLLNASLFFYVIVLVNFQRGLVRHSFMEYNDSYLSSTFYLATSILLFYFVRYYSVAYRFLIFFGSAFLLMITLTYFPMAKEKTPMENFLTNMSVKNLNHTIHDSNLVGRMYCENEFDKKTFVEFRSFLDANLNTKQTFLDFSNSPMLYFFCQRKVPSYFCQSLQNTIDEFTQKEQLKRLNPINIPVVVFSNYPPNWFDATDNVPNAMRYPYLAEYIFSQYKPLAVINNKSVWVSKILSSGCLSKQKDTLAGKPVICKYKKAARILNEYYNGNAKYSIDKMSEVIPSKDSFQRMSIELPIQLQKQTSVFVKLFISNPNGQEIRCDLIQDTMIVGSYTFETELNTKEYMIRLSNQYNWFQVSVSQLRFENLIDQHIERIQFYKEKN